MKPAFVAVCALCGLATSLLTIVSCTDAGKPAGPSTLASAAPATTPATTRRAAPYTDANGNYIRTARTGHISNYDESRVTPYTLPAVLKLQNGRSVNDTRTWETLRRPELLKLYQSEIYGRVPANAPTITWTVTSTEPAFDGMATRQLIVGRAGDKPDGPAIHLTLILPVNAGRRVPVILCGNFPPRTPAATRPSAATASRPVTASVPATAAAVPTGIPDPIADILARHWGYASFIYTDIQPDRARTYTQGVIGLTLAPGQTEPAPDEWGSISAWAWGYSRIIDHLETVPAIDAHRIAIMGTSRLGKTALWAGAQDPRVAAVFASCAGELGSALARRDFGESVDDMVENFPWQFAINFRKYLGHWNDLPVDAHMLIALNAPHPVFINGGTTDQWSDPRGEFLAEVAAGPVYQLLGKKDLGTSNFPTPDTPLLAGDLGFIEHTGGHFTAAQDWRAFLEFAARTLDAPTPRVP